MMRNAARSRIWSLVAGPLVLAATAWLIAVAPAAAQRAVVEYSPDSEIALKDTPLTLAVVGWPAPGFTRALRSEGRVENRAEPVAVRYAGYFARDGYAGITLMADSSRGPLQAPTSAADVTRLWPYLTNHKPVFGEPELVQHGRMAVTYIPFDLDDNGRKACFLYYGAHSHWLLRGYVCANGSASLAPLAASFIRGLGYPGVLTPVTASLPPVGGPSAARPAAAMPPRDEAASVPLSNAELVAHLEKSTVLVIAQRARGSAVGTGFFVSPTRLLTNRHVVDGARRVVVTSRALGKPYPAQIITRTDRAAIGAADYALLEVPNVSHDQLRLAPEIAKLQEVIAAGYPGVTISNDEGFRALAQGDASSAPDLVITRGEVNAIQINNANIPTIAHTALISEGNSGGPLVDRCGRVVGINSYIAHQTTVTGFAIASGDLIDFLNRNGVHPTIAAAPCLATGEVRR